MNKNSLLVLLASSVLITSTLVACGGAKDDTEDAAPGAAVASGTATNDGTSPAFDLKGFKKCGKQGDILDLKVKTHVAFGLESQNRFVYLYAQTGKLLLSAEVFGNDPVDWLYKEGYCKPVTADNNDAVVFAAAMANIKRHLDGTAVMTAAQVQEQNDRITHTTYTLADNKTNIARAFDVIKAYEAKEKGPFFINAKTKDGFPNHPSKPDGFEIDRAVLAIQQSIFDFAYTPGGLKQFRDTLAGQKFNSSDWYPGKVKVPAIASAVYTVKINATVAEDVESRSAFSQHFARRPTGYYLAAGDIAKVTVPLSLVNKGFEIRVGASVHDKYIKNPIERPFRVSNKFPIVSEVTEIANPHGGGIYIDVPYLAKGGASVDIKIQNAVPAPLFSSTALNTTTLKQWQEIQRNNPAPWADFESDKFMMTLPTSWIYNYADPVTLMKDWDNRMDVVTKYVGRSQVQNNKILYITVDTSLASNGHGIGYPSGNNGYHPKYPTDGNSKNWFLVPGIENVRGADIELHELGHAQLFDNFSGEGEAAVNMLYIAVANQLYGKSIDEALGESMGGRPHLGPHLTREVAAVNWMVTANFRDGKAMDTTEAKHEVKYQQRGYAKYAEIAALFGWEKINAYYAQENNVFRKLATAADKNLGLNADEGRILKWSIAAGTDLTPLIHFWGVQPSTANAAKLSAAINAAGLKPSLAIYNRLQVYRGLIPLDNAAFKAHAVKFLNVKSVAEITGADSSHNNGPGWYAYNLEKYNAAEGRATQIAFDGIFTKYFPGGKPAQ
jgi:Peptidase M60, enhancin and enhancin-like/N-terminal domain of M60-like peptidases